MRNILIALLLIGTSNFVFGQDKGSPDLPGDLIVNVGINGMIDRSTNLKLNAFNSRSLGIYYTNRIEISPSFSFYPAIGIGSEKYAFQRLVTFDRNEDAELEFKDIDDLGSIDKSVLAVNYLEVPVEFRYFPFKSKDGSGLFVGVGGSIGFRVESHTKIKYTTPAPDEIQVVDKFRNDFDLANLRYGLIGRIGTRGINAFYRVHLSQLFKTDAEPEDKNPTTYTFGISINAF